jgi:hypothetical protein
MYKHGEKMITDSDSIKRHKTCKFGDYIRLGDPTNPVIHAGCMNDHCRRIVKTTQCIMCGYYSKKY